MRVFLQKLAAIVEIPNLTLTVEVKFIVQHVEYQLNHLQSKFGWYLTSWYLANRFESSKSQITEIWAKSRPPAGELAPPPPLGERREHRSSTLKQKAGRDEASSRTQSRTLTVHVEHKGRWPPPSRSNWCSTTCCCHSGHCSQEISILDQLPVRRVNAGAWRVPATCAASIDGGADGGAVAAIALARFERRMQEHFGNPDTNVVDFYMATGSGAGSVECAVLCLFWFGFWSQLSPSSNVQDLLLVLGLAVTCINGTRCTWWSRLLHLREFPDSGMICAYLLQFEHEDFLNKHAC